MSVEGKGAPKMSEAGKITGNNLIEGMKLRNKQMRFLLDNISEPDLSLIGSNGSLASSLGIEESECEEVNTQGITWRILNTRGFGNFGSGDPSNHPSFMSVAVFMNDIQSYLPRSLRIKKKREKYYRLWKRESFCNTNTFSEETEELLNQMSDWLWMMKNKIEDIIASRYFINGRTQHLEILKRRYKDGWSEKIEQSVDSNISGPKSLKIDFGEDEESTATE